MRRRDFLAAVGCAVIAAPFSARLALAAAQARRFKIGWLVFGGRPLGSIDQALIEALAQRSFVDGRTVEFIFRFAGSFAFVSL